MLNQVTQNEMVTDIINNGTTDRVYITKNKLVLINRLLRRLKTKYQDNGDKDRLKKANLQRTLLENFFDNESIEKYINKLKKELDKE